MTSKSKKLYFIIYVITGQVWLGVLCHKENKILNFSLHETRLFANPGWVVKREQAVHCTWLNPIILCLTCWLVPRKITQTIQISVHLANYVQSSRNQFEFHPDGVEQKGNSSLLRRLLDSSVCIFITVITIFFRWRKGGTLGHGKRNSCAIRSGTWWRCRHGCKGNHGNSVSGLVHWPFQSFLFLVRIA